ncbi:eukaryotic translation initiation factor 4E [Aspergillus tubingensis]
MKALQSGVAQKGKVPIVSPNAAFSKPSKLQVVIFCRRLKKSPSITTSFAVILPGADDSTFREPSAPLPAPTLSPSTLPSCAFRDSLSDTKFAIRAILSLPLRHDRFPSHHHNPAVASSSTTLTFPSPPQSTLIMAAVAENGHAPVADENAAPVAAAVEQKEQTEKTNGDSVTVFHDPENFTVKHPLMHEWTLWFTKPPSGKGDNWNDLLKEVVTFNSVEEFWGIYNNISPTSELGLKADYHLFKKGVRPEWEDPQNKHGGKWSYSFKDKRSVPIDDLWLHAQLAAIGETLENDGDNEVMGVVVNVRKGFYRVGLWTRTVGKSVPGDKNGRTPAQGKEILENIGRRFKEVLRLKEADAVEFSGHTDSAHSGSTRAKAKYTV